MRFYIIFYTLYDFTMAISLYLCLYKRLTILTSYSYSRCNQIIISLLLWKLLMLYKYLMQQYCCIIAQSISLNDRLLEFLLNSFLCLQVSFRYVTCCVLYLTHRVYLLPQNVPATVTLQVCVLLF